jgi:hypothetical protein
VFCHRRRLSVVSDLIDDQVCEILKRLSEDRQSVPDGRFVVMGSWPAKQLANALGDAEATVLTTYVAEGLTDKLKANDIDVYYGSESSAIELVPERNAKRSIFIGGIKLELDTVPVRNLCVQKLLANNDINAIAVAFEVNSSGKMRQSVPVVLSPGSFYPQEVSR